MALYNIAEPTKDLWKAMQGIWWLLSREDHTKDGHQRFDQIMGTNPIGILAYAKDTFSAQFMKLDHENTVISPVDLTAKNNTVAVNGYDAYFGQYSVDESTGRVAHTLIGSITRDNIGLTVSRDIRVHGLQLICLPAIDSLSYRNQCDISKNVTFTLLEIQAFTDFCYWTEQKEDARLVLHVITQKRGEISGQMAAAFNEYKFQ